MASWDIVIFCVFMALTLYIGIREGRHVKDLQTFALHRHSYSSFALISTLVASFIGGGVLLGTAEKAFLHGIGPLIVLFGYILQLWITAAFLAPRLSRFNYSLSTGDIMRYAYGQWAGVLSGLLWLGYCSGVIVLQLSAMGRLFSSILPTDDFTNIIMSASIIMIYCYYGGIRGVVATDVLQFVIMIVTIPLALGLSIHYAGGWSAAYAKIPAAHMIPTTYKDTIGLVMMFLGFIIGDILFPPMVQRILMAKDAKQATFSLTVAGFCYIPMMMVAGMLGFAAYAINPSIPAAQAFPFLIQEALPGWGRVLAVAGLISVIMSTADSFLNSGAVAIVNDIVKPLMKNPLSDQRQLKLAKLSTLVITLVSIHYASLQASIFDLVFKIYEFWGPTIVIPLIVAVCLGTHMPGWIFYIACGAGGMVPLLWPMFDLEKQLGFSALIPGMLINALVFGSAYSAHRFQLYRTRPK
jgi:SSS family solute:Na+ symporter